MTEQYQSFDDIRKSFIDSNGEVDSRLNRSTVFSLLKENELFRNNMDDIIGMSVFIEMTNWGGKQFKRNSDAVLEDAKQLQEMLNLDYTPVAEIETPNEGMWNRSLNPTDFDRALAMRHNEIISEYEKADPSLKEVHQLVGTAAHWLARIAGAKWYEAVHVSRWAQEYIHTNFDNNTYGPIMNSYIHMYDKEEYGKN